MNNSFAVYAAKLLEYFLAVQLKMGGIKIGSKP